MVSHFRSIRGTSLVACTQTISHRSTARGRGQVRRSLQSHTFLHKLQASKFERKANRNEVFIATRDSRRLHYHFPLFYLQAASKTQAFDASDTLWRPTPVELTLKPALYSSSSQIHADSSSTTHTGTGRRSRPGVGFTCFPKPHALSPIPANHARSSSADQAQIAIDDMATGRPRA